jgi:hypothetical protein
MDNNANYAVARCADETRLTLRQQAKMNQHLTFRITFELLDGRSDTIRGASASKVCCP